MMKNLAKDLLAFDFLSNQSKVELWLTYKDIKPVSAVALTHGNNNSDEAENKLRDWIVAAGLIIEKDNNSQNYFVSKKQDLIDEIKPIVFGNTKEDILKKSRLYGYPESTVLAAYRNFTDDKEGLPIGVALTKEDSEKIPWWIYVRYIVRVDHKKEDSMVAKIWREVIKADLPELDKEFEKEILGAKISQM